MKRNFKHAHLFTLCLAALLTLSACGATPETGVLMAFDFGDSATKAHESYLQSFKTTLNSITVKARVGVMPITNKAGSNPIAWAQFPDHSTLKVLKNRESKSDLEDKAAASREELTAGVETMRRIGVETSRKARDPEDLGTNVLAVLLQAQDELRSYPSDRRFLFIYSDMINQSPELEMTKTRPLDPAATISMLKSKGMIPDLGGVKVYVVGPGSATKVSFTSEEIQRIRQFWMSYLAEAKARVIYYGDSPPSHCINDPGNC